MTLLPTKRRHGFTLIEMLVVITIIVVLVGLAFPAFQGVQNSARKTQAKNDLLAIVNGVNAYYTEYGKYPLLPTETGDLTFGESNPKTAELMNVLRANGAVRDDPNGANLNPRRIVFVQWPAAKDPNKPKSGIGGDGQPYDPWGRTYLVKVDGNYDNAVGNPYKINTGAGFDPLGFGVIAWSAGKDGVFGPLGADKNSDVNAKDDILSWQ